MRGRHVQFWSTWLRRRAGRERDVEAPTRRLAGQRRRAGYAQPGALREEPRQVEGHEPARALESLARMVAVMSETMFAARWNAIQTELAWHRRRLKRGLPTAGARAACELQVTKYEGFLTALRSEREAARASQSWKEAT